MSRTTGRLDHLGPPQIQLGGLQIWVHGRAYPDHEDYWDGNWLRLTAHCGGNGADVWVDGPILHLSEIRAWYNGLVHMNESVTGEAKLGGLLEPNLFIEMKIDLLGHVLIQVNITPDHMAQKHVFEFENDQTFLGPLIAQCDAVLAEYPVRDDPRGQR